MSDQTEQKYTKLYFKNDYGENALEYLPSDNSKFTDWFRYKYVKARGILGLNVYYWHIRHSHTNNDRKKLDLNFINHVVIEHGNEPDDPIENRHFKKAWDLYGSEVNYVIDEFKKCKNKNGKYELTPELNSYVEKWHSIYQEPDRKFMYHGMKLVDYMHLLILFDEREKQRILEYCKKNGLDPITGKKLH